MKILQINTTVNSGSTGRIAEEIGNVILENKGESFVAYAFKGEDSDSSEIVIGNKIDFYFHVFKTRILDEHGKGSKNATKEFIKKIECINPDIIHLHNIHGYYFNYPIFFDFINRTCIPVVWTFHDCWPFTGHCAYFDRFKCEKWKKECYDCPMTKYYPTSWLVDNSNKNFKLKRHLFIQPKNLIIVTPSHWLKNLVVKSFFKNKSVHVIHNGIDLNIFKPLGTSIKEKFDLLNYKIILGVASIWDNRKGLEDFIKLNEILEKEFKIILVGLTKNQISNLPEGIIGINRTENVKELAELYSSSDVYLNPTYSDNFPTTNIESLACGTPVITYDTGGSPESIDENSGIVVGKGDINGLKSAIQRIMKSKEKYSANDCRNRAVDKFNKENRFEDYINIYQNILLNEI